MLELRLPSSLDVLSAAGQGHPKIAGPFQGRSPHDPTVHHCSAGRFQLQIDQRHPKLFNTREEVLTRVVHLNTLFCLRFCSCFVCHQHCSMPGLNFKCTKEWAAEFCEHSSLCLSEILPFQRLTPPPFLCPLPLLPSLNFKPVSKRQRAAYHRA